MAAALLAAILFFSVKVNALSAEKVFVLDADTGHVLYEKNADSRSLIASTTKIMTALVVCEQSNVLDRVRIPKEAIGIEGSSLYLKEGEILTVQELLYGLMLHSGNDAAVALAIYCGGTVEGFVQVMNDKAKNIGLTQTHFQNPHGLDAPQHYSTARDLAMLASYAMKNPVFRQTVSTKNVRITNRDLRNHNKLLWRVEGVDGVKTGYTKAAGRILVSSACRGSRRLVAVTINAPSDWLDHESVLNQGFSHYAEQPILFAGDCLGYADISGSDSGQVSLIAADDLWCMLADWETPRVVLQDFGIIYAPVSEGEVAGFAYVLVDDAVVGRVPVVFGETVEQIESRKVPFWKILFGCDK